jgi:hypothetical protein
MELPHAPPGCWGLQPSYTKIINSGKNRLKPYDNGSDHNNPQPTEQPQPIIGHWLSKLSVDTYYTNRKYYQDLNVKYDDDNRMDEPCI